MSQKHRYGRFLNGRVLDPVKIGRIAVPFVVLLLWQVLSMVFGSFVLPSPSATYGGIQAGIEQGWVVNDFSHTLFTVVIAFVLATAMGIGLGFVLGLNDKLFEVFEIYVLGFYATPRIVLFPIFLLFFGLGRDQKVAFGMFFGLFPILLITMSAVNEVPEIYLKVSRSLRASRLQTFKSIIVPSILIQLVVGIRLAFSLTFLGVIIAELFGAEKGLGVELQHAMGTVNQVKLMAIVTVLLVTALVVNLFFYYTQLHLERQWHISTDETGY